MLWFRPVFFEELFSSQCRQSYHLLVEWDLPLLLSFNRFVRREKQVPLVNVSNCPSCLLNVVHPSLSAAVTPCHPPSVAQAMQTRRNRWASSWAPCTLNTISTNTPTHTLTHTHHTLLLNSCCVYTAGEKEYSVFINKVEYNKIV